MAFTSMTDWVGKVVPNPDPAIQRRMERAQPFRAELIAHIRVVWAVALAGLIVFKLWRGVNFEGVLLEIAFPVFWLLCTWSRNKPFSGAALLVSVVFGTMFLSPVPQSGGLVILTIVLAGLVVGEFFVGIWTFVCAGAFAFGAMPQISWQVSLGWSLVYVAAGWLVILFSRHLERLVEVNLSAEEQQRGAIVEERTRFAREIHDTLAQGFTGIMMQLNAAEQRLPPESEAQPFLEKARELARESLDEARRSVSALRLGVLANSSLMEAIQQIGGQLLAESKIKLETRIDGAPVALTESRETNLLRIAQEALTNAARHSGAERITVRLSYQAGSTSLEIEDNGRGMADNPTGGFGINGMRERARQCGGQIDIRSYPDRGTRIVVIVPNV